MARKSLKKYERKVVVRPLQPRDFDAVFALQKEVLDTIPPWTREEFLSQLKTFRAGQTGIEIDGKLVAISSSLLVSGDTAKSMHDFDEITDDGFIRNHEKNGDYLYGIDIAVAADFQGQRLARRLYDTRKRLVRRRNLRGMIICGRIPEYHRHAAEMTAEEYVEKVQNNEIADPVLLAQLANGFVIRRLIKDYLPEDAASCGYGVLMEWENPDYSPEEGQSLRWPLVRVCVVQYQMRGVTRFDQFSQQCEYFVSTASDYRSDFILFPELITTQLLSMVTADRPKEAAQKLDRYTGRYLDFFTDLAIRYNINIIGGTHLTTEDGRIYNVAYLFRRDGTLGKQYKLHITPAEVRWWGVSPGEELQVFDTDCGRIAILICYDVEFPELARLAAEKGANILFVPYNTDMRSGHLRVSHCAHARCIENHLYAAISGVTGNLPSVDAVEIHYAQSGIYTPSDVSFDRDAVAAECTPNVEMVIVHDLNIDLLAQHRQFGSVRNWSDRRTDLYRIRFKDGNAFIDV